MLRPISLVRFAVVVSFAVAVGIGCADGDGAPDDAGTAEPEPEPEPVPPTAVIGGVVDGAAPLALTLDAGASTAGDAPLATFAWSIDDAPVGEGATLDVTLVAWRAHTIALVVTDEEGLSHSASVVVNVSPEACPLFKAPAVRGSLNAAAMTETSGLVASTKTPGAFFAHNDSGAGPYVFAITATGALIDAYEIAGASAYDWEDIAAGPGPEEGERYLYVGDVGDNDYVRTSVRIYRVKEPVLDDTDEPAVLTTESADVLTLTYPGARENVEGLVVDPKDGALYLFSKGYDARSRVYRASPMVAGNSSEVLTQVATLDVNGAGTSTPLITAVDVSPRGNLVVVRTYTHLFAWPRDVDAPFADTFAGTRCAIAPPNEPQGEAVAFDLDGRTVLTVSEGAGAPVYHLARDD